MYANTSSPHEMNLLNVENGWKLLRDKVFGQKHDHPPELEEIGKKIVEKCQGLPLTISVIGGHLFTYHHLPIHLKPCFLFMGRFPEDFQVASRRLIQLWIAEGFVAEERCVSILNIRPSFIGEKSPRNLTPNQCGTLAFCQTSTGLIRTSRSRKSLEEVAEDYLEDLIKRNLIMARKRRFNGEIKTCVIRDLLREFCLIEAKTTKFMHVERTCHTPPTQKHNVRRFNFQTQYYSVDKCCRLLLFPHLSTYFHDWLEIMKPLLRFSGYCLSNIVIVM
ncbi:toMV resistant protein Tm-2 netted virescent-like [Nicotiana tabacum]|uniref:ToMV resistant protein Tm-2 netted virescent-like n=1 Tax=Nicotiana tabacum TaxID=4097 RepID=A0AC58SU13_TOBAC